jgi:hypothetical protein
MHQDRINGRAHLKMLLITLLNEKIGKGVPEKCLLN